MNIEINLPVLLLLVGIALYAVHYWHGEAVKWKGLAEGTMKTLDEAMERVRIMTIRHY